MPGGGPLPTVLCNVAALRPLRTGRDTMRSLILSIALLLLLPAGWAQPSTTCVTPSVRCKAAYPGPVGAACSCQTAKGWVRGRLG